MPEEKKDKPQEEKEAVKAIAVKKDAPPAVKKETPPAVKPSTAPAVKKDSPPALRKETPPAPAREGAAAPKGPASRPGGKRPSGGDRGPRPGKGPRGKGRTERVDIPPPSRTPSMGELLGEEMKKKLEALKKDKK